MNPIIFALILMQTPSDAIRVCQVGYLAQETKYAVLTVDADDAIVRRTTDNFPALPVKVGRPFLDPDTGDTVRLVDFSELEDAGQYLLEVPGVGRSYPFVIGKDAFARPFRLAMRAFTGQRCGTDVSLAPDFPEYNYKACHTAPAQYHESSGKTGTRDCRGGWHDAGDYGKYVVNSGITTGTLLWAFELNEPKLSRKKLDLPESGNKVPDMLDEIRWNLDWMLKMQDEDGGAWHKETTANFPGFLMPEDDKGPTLIIGTGEEPYKNTAATADLAAVAAAAARVFKKYDPAYAAKCLTAAENAWSWLQKHPDNTFRNPRGVNTGGYGDRDPSDERLWAAAELFRTTGKKEYDAYFLENHAKWQVKGDAAQGWPVVNNMAKFAYALGRGGDRKAKDAIKAESVQAAKEIVERIGKNGYRVPLMTKDYIWGSNGVVANYGVMLLVANRFQKNDAFRNGALDCLHYLFGRNAFNTSYVTHVGTKWAMNPHHRPSGADSIEQPWPGLVMGGPNASGKTPPAKQWEDKLASFTTNEIAINWQAPLVFLLAEFTD